jgi:hypothetical protein
MVDKCAANGWRRGQNALHELGTQNSKNAEEPADPYEVRKLVQACCHYLLSARSAKEIEKEGK